MVNISSILIDTAAYIGCFERKENSPLKTLCIYDNNPVPKDAVNMAIVLNTNIDHIGLMYLAPTSTFAIAADAVAAIAVLTGCGSANIVIITYTAMLNIHAMVTDAANSFTDQRNSVMPI
ncbi:MAG: hypothetical protein P1P69_01725 [Methanosarcinaceae archaeon]|nr:hypothetical protein [Methanosarcinaceae archaeon]